MTEGGIRILAEIHLHSAPVSAVITDFFAIAANGHHSAEGFDMCQGGLQIAQNFLAFNCQLLAFDGMNQGASQCSCADVSLYEVVLRPCVDETQTQLITFCAGKDDHREGGKLVLKTGV